MGDAYGAGMINHVSTEMHELQDDEENGSIKSDHTKGLIEENGNATTTTF